MSQWTFFVNGSMIWLYVKLKGKMRDLDLSMLNNYLCTEDSVQVMFQSPNFISFIPPKMDVKNENIL